MIIIAYFVEKRRLSVFGIAPRCIPGIGDIIGTIRVKSTSVWIRGIYGYVILGIEIYIIIYCYPFCSTTAADTRVVVRINGAITLSVHTCAFSTASSCIAVDNVIPDLGNVKAII